MTHLPATATDDTLDAQLNLDRLLATIPDVAFVTDADGRIEQANGHAVDKLEFDPEDFVGRRISDFRVSGTSIPCLVDAPAEDGGPTGGVSHYRRRQGTLFTARAARMPLAASASRSRTLTVLGEVATDAQFAHVIHTL